MSDKGHYKVIHGVYYFPNGYDAELTVELCEQKGLCASDNADLAIALSQAQDYFQNKIQERLDEEGLLHKDFEDEYDVVIMTTIYEQNKIISETLIPYTINAYYYGV